MEITRQADYYGLDTPDRDPAPPPEKVAEQLRPATPWSGPMKVAAVDSPWEKVNSQTLLTKMPEGHLEQGRGPEFGNTRPAGWWAQGPHRDDEARAQARQMLKKESE